VGVLARPGCSMTAADVTRPVRSFLYVPGDREDRVTKALAAGADAVLVDLEDAVAPAAKGTARDVVLRLIRSRPAKGPQLWVRINAGDIGRDDVAALAPAAAGLDGLVLAKCDDPDWLDEVGSSFPPPLPLSPLVESALAVRRLDALCSHPRVTQCHLGEIDLLADLGVPADAIGALNHARNELVFASAAAEILSPIGGVFTAVRDVEALLDDSVRLARNGFFGRPALHPVQVPTINAAFRPSPEELAAAASLVAYYDTALQRGHGAVTDDNGRMIDEAVVRRARRLLQTDQPNRPR
jgi:citrate lyase subunit beta/citryl-CoA lyase